MKSVLEHTYFLFTRDSNSNLTKFLGPVFDEEIEQYKVESFDNHKNVEALDEETFKLIYSDDYLKDFDNNWTDYVACLFDKLELDFDIIVVGQSDDPDLDIEEEEDNDPSEFYDGEELIIIHDLCAIKREENDLCIQFHFESDSTHAAILVLEMQKYCQDLFEITILKPSQEEIDQYYKDKLKETYLN